MDIAREGWNSLTNKPGRCQLLGWCLEADPDREYSQMDIVRSSECSKGTVQRYVGDIVQLGVLEIERNGSYDRYVVDTDHPILESVAHLGEQCWLYFEDDL